jgi:hypothetical protein
MAPLAAPWIVPPPRAACVGVSTPACAAGAVHRSTQGCSRKRNRASPRRGIPRTPSLCNESHVRPAPYPTRTRENLPFVLSSLKMPFPRCIFTGQTGETYAARLHRDENGFVAKHAFVVTSPSPVTNARRFSTKIGPSCSRVGPAFREKTREVWLIVFTRPRQAPTKSWGILPPTPAPTSSISPNPSQRGQAGTMHRFPLSRAE